MRRLGLTALLAAVLCGTASAQETTGTITGVTTDSTAGVRPGVTVTLRNTDNTLRTVVTNEEGIYPSDRF